MLSLRPVPNTFIEKVQKMVTPELRAQVMDHRDPEKHGAAIVELLESHLKIRGGLRHLYEHPCTEIICMLRDEVVIMAVETPEQLFDDTGTLHVVCDQYATLAREVLLSAISPRIQKPKVLALTGRAGEHYGIHFAVDGTEHESTGMPRFYKKMTGWTKEELKYCNFLWHQRIIGTVIADERRARPHFVPYMEFPDGNGYGVMGACLTIINGERTKKIRGQITILFNDGRIWEVSAEIPIQNMNGRKYTAEQIMPRLEWLRMGRASNETITIMAADAMASLFSKKLEWL